MKCWWTFDPGYVWWSQLLRPLHRWHPWHSMARLVFFEEPEASSWFKETNAAGTPGNVLGCSCLELCALHYYSMPCLLTLSQPTSSFLNSLRVEMVKSPQTFSLSRKKGWRNDETYETWSSNMFTSRSLGTRASFGAGAIHQGASSRLRTYWCPRTDFAPACTWTGPEKLKLIGKSIMDCLSKNCGKEHCTPCPILPEKCGIDHAEVFKWRLTIGFTTMHILFFAYIDNMWSYV